MKDISAREDTTTTVEISDPQRLVAAPLVSVYMLAYNHAEYISQAIECVLAQQCDFAFELILGEDHSADRTLDIAIGYQRRFPRTIRILTSDSNVGAHRNAARCLSAARGEFVAICEGDDYWHHPGKLQMQVDRLREEPAAHIVHTDFDRLVGRRVLRNAHKRQRTPYLAQGDAFTALLHRMTVMTATVMYRRNILLKLQSSGIASDSWPFGDYPKALFAAMHGPVAYIPISTATYRMVPGSATNKDRARGFALQKAALDCSSVFMVRAGVDPDSRRDILSKLHQELRTKAAMLGDKALFRSEDSWLLEHSGPRARFSRAFLILLVEIPLALKVYRTGLRTARRLGQWLRYRKLK